MTGKVTIGIIDNSEEVSSTGLHTPVLNAGNIATYLDNTLGGALGDYRLAVSALSLGNITKATVVAQTFPEADQSPPADTNAQRERKALVTYQDTVTGKKYTTSIPAFNMAGVSTGSDAIDLSNPLWAAFVLVVESNYQSELGNSIVVLSAKHVGRAS